MNKKKKSSKITRSAQVTEKENNNGCFFNYKNAIIGTRARLAEELSHVWDDQFHLCLG